MKHGFVAIMMILGVVGSAQAQSGSLAVASPEGRAALEAELQAAMAGGGGRARASVETRVTRGAPYSGDAITEFTQTLADGNRIVRRSVTRTFRDSEGRTRREQTTTGAAGDTVSITIVDPVAAVSYILDPQNRSARQFNVMIAMPSRVPPSGMGRGGGRGGVATATASPSGAASGVPAVQGPTQVQPREAERSARVDQSENSRTAAGSMKIAAERAVSGEGTSTTENLGQQVLEGVMAEGTRTTTVIPAGGIGNAQPITIISEQWFSPDLQVLVMTRHSDPRSGETVYRLSNIVRGEPDRSLFEVPADYTMKEPSTVLRRREPGL
jgi:hypothetical protein